MIKFDFRLIDETIASNQSQFMPGLSDSKPKRPLIWPKWFSRKAKSNLDFLQKFVARAMNKF